MKCEGEKVKICYSAPPQWPLLKIRCCSHSLIDMPQELQGA